MTKYLITERVVSLVGYTIEADSEEEARQSLYDNLLEPDFDETENSEIVSVEVVEE